MYAYLYVIGRVNYPKKSLCNNQFGGIDNNGDDGDNENISPGQE